MQGYKYSQIMNPFFDMPTDYKEAVKVYKTLAKTADQRLLRLERYSERENFGNALTYAYARAQRDIRAWSGEKATRFNTKAPENMQQLLAKIQDIKTFLGSESSTMEGLRTINEKRANTLNEKYGTEFSASDLAQFFESGGFNDYIRERIAGSDTAMETLGVIHKHKAEIVSKIEKARKQHRRVQVDFTKGPDHVDEVINEQINELLRKHPKQVLEFLKV